MIICDTSTLSEFFRRKKIADEGVAAEIGQLIESQRVILLGIVRQELLSGIKHDEQFVELELKTRALPIYFAEDADHLIAAKFLNICRSKGIQG